VDDAVKSNSEPAPPPDIRWPEESVGLRRDELILDARRSRTPQVWKPVIVVAMEPQGQELLTYEESWRSVAQLLRHAGKTHANDTESLFEVRVHHEMDINFRPATAPTGRVSEDVYLKTLDRELLTGPIRQRQLRKEAAESLQALDQASRNA
jgi:hypothetical protein